MKNPFTYLPNHPHRLGIIVGGLAEILDGLVAVFSFGFFVSDFTWKALFWSHDMTHQSLKQSDRERH